MVDYRDDFNPLNDRTYQDSGSSGAGGALVALIVVLLGLVAIFWYAGGQAPENGTAAPALENSAPATPTTTIE